MTDSEMMDLMNAFGSAFAAGNVEGVVACLADDFVWTLPTGQGDPQGLVLSGKEDVRTYLRERFGQAKTLNFSDGRRELVGDLVISRYRVRGVSPDGRKIDSVGVDIYRLGDGKLRSKEAFWKQVCWADS